MSRGKPLSIKHTYDFIQKNYVKFGKLVSDIYFKSQ